MHEYTTDIPLLTCCIRGERFLKPVACGRQYQARVALRNLLLLHNMQPQRLVLSQQHYPTYYVRQRNKWLKVKIIGLHHKYSDIRYYVEDANQFTLYF